jgi:hypothetical protein
LKLQSEVKSLLLKAITILYDGAMKKFVTLLLACCFGSVMAQSNLPECPPGRYSLGDEGCFGSHEVGNGSSYVGEFKRGYRNGQGVLTTSDGVKVLGDWKYGELSGRGIVFREDGLVIRSGKFKDGKLQTSQFIDLKIFTRIDPKLIDEIRKWARINQAEETKPQQAELEEQLAAFPACEGEVWKWNDCFGTYTNAKGFKYVGAFKNGQYHGLGVESRPDGVQLPPGIYEADTLSRSVDETYKAESIRALIEQKINEAATLQRLETAKREAQAELLQAQQQANETEAAKRKQAELEEQLAAFPACEGEVWKWNDCFGTYTNAKGFKYVGAFKNGQYHGLGVESRPDGVQLPPGIYKADRFVRALDEAYEVKSLRAVIEQKLGLVQKSNAKAESLEMSALAEVEGKRKSTTGEPSEIEKIRAEAEAAKRKQAELEAQLAAVQQAQVKPTVSAFTQGKRVALVIGNAKYKFNPLNNPVNDATDMAASLRSVGFDVIEVKDATLKQMREATRRFADKLEVSDVGLVYYSGHGIEVKGTNYLIPVNADIRREYEVVDQAFDASNLLRMMESLQGSVKKRVNILIVDACRNNDLPKSWRSTNNGLARMDAPAGSFISFATAPGQVASDGNGRNSPYTKHLLNALKQPNVPIEQVFKQVRRNVMDETGGEQVPWENSSMIGDFYFTVAR